MRYFLFMLVSFVLLLTSCNKQKLLEKDSTSTEDVQQSQMMVSAKSTSKKNESPCKITIYRYGNFPMLTAQALCKELKKTFPEVVISDEILSLPAEHYFKERNRYKGGALLQDLKKHQNGDAVIGLTNQIIYQPNEISPTFGIMGLSPMGTYTCVVSSKIPRNGQTHTLENFVKLALHELGHAYGLPHCPD